MTEVLSKEVFDDFQKRKETLQLNHSFDNFEKTCYIANELSVKKDLFLKVYERRNKFIILLKKVGRAKIKIYDTFHLV